MKSLLLALCVAVAGSSLALSPIPAEAKRLGGGKAAGMQRQMPAKPADASPAPSQASPAVPGAAAPMAGAATGAAAAAGKRSWLGPVAGLAAGLGLAALASHLGFGEGLANLMTMLLIAGVAFFAIRWIMGRMAANRAPTRNTGGLAMAGATAGPSGYAGNQPDAAPLRPAPMARQADLPSTAGVNLPPLQPAAGSAAGAATGAAAGFAAAPASLPAGFDAAGFERLAKMVFIRLQAANDRGAVEDLRKFTTPELFASLRLDLQERGQTQQHTDVVELDAHLLDVTQEHSQWVATVRFQGLIREELGAEAQPFNELWHLVKPVDGSAEWAIAGITPVDLNPQ